MVCGLDVLPQLGRAAEPSFTLIPILTFTLTQVCGLNVLPQLGHAAELSGLLELPPACWRVLPAAAIYALALHRWQRRRHTQSSTRTDSEPAEP